MSDLRSELRIEILPAQPSDRDRAELSTLLIACVRSGASIGFLESITEAEAAVFWAKIFADLVGGHRVALVAREADGAIAGSAQIVFATMPNGRHRAEVQKVMVRPSHRRRGLATRLMSEIEALARARGVWLLFLDTSDSHAGARPLYEALGYVYVGGIPGYATDPQGRPEQNAIYYKTLAPGA